MDGESAGDHARGCAECAAWVAARARARAALELVARIPAAPELDERVAFELSPAGRVQRLERVLSSLVRLGAPPELDARVDEFLAAPDAAEVRGRAKAAALRALDIVEAPAVLERLLAEELADPKRAGSSRFSASLRRLRAPSDLERRLGDATRRRAVARLVLGPILALGAAGLVVWLAVRSDDVEPPARRFEVVRAASLEDLDPLARMLAGSLGGADPR